MLVVGPLPFLHSPDVLDSLVVGDPVAGEGRETFGGPFLPDVLSELAHLTG